MTTIVACTRSGMLGADTFASTAYRAAKVFRTKSRGIFGCAGDDTAISRFESWLIRGAKKPLPISSESSEGFEALQLHKGRLFIWGTAMRPELILHPLAVNGEPIPALFAAIGTGAPWAMGCLMQGGTLGDALCIAELFDANSKGPYQFFKEIE